MPDLQCPRCDSTDLAGLVCRTCRMAWPSAAFLDPTTPQAQAAHRRWKAWTLKNRDSTARQWRGYLLNA